MGERNLEVNIRVTSSEYYIMVTENETGDFVQYGPYVFGLDEDEERFGQDIKSEIYSWVDITREQMEDDDE